MELGYRANKITYPFHYRWFPYKIKRNVYAKVFESYGDIRYVFNYRKCFIKKQLK